MKKAMLAIVAVLGFAAVAGATDQQFVVVNRVAVQRQFVVAAPVQRVQRVVVTPVQRVQRVVVAQPVQRVQRVVVAQPVQRVVVSQGIFGQRIVVR